MKCKFVRHHLSSMKLVANNSKSICEIGYFSEDRNIFCTKSLYPIKEYLSEASL